MIHFDLGHCCSEFIETWWEWSLRFDHRSVALLPILSEDEYMERIGSKSRNMVRKSAKAGFEYFQFDYNDELDGIYQINRSKPIRQGKAMAGSYQERPEPQADKSSCPVHSYDWIGGFRDGQIWAYCNLVRINELAVVNRILGHKDALKDGVMNGLLLHLVLHCHGTPVTHINYLTIQDSPPGLQRFKLNVGFRSEFWQIGGIDGN